MKVFWSSLEYKYGSNPGKLNGGFVYAFVNAVSPEVAIAEVIKKLNEKDLVLENLEFIVEYNLSTEWETEQLTEYYKSLYMVATACDDVIFDDFYAFEET